MVCALLQTYTEKYTSVVYTVLFCEISEHFSVPTEIMNFVINGKNI
jgi:hypothetical protein